MTTPTMTDDGYTLETMPLDHLALAALGSHPGDRTFWDELVRRCREDGADPYKVIAATLHSKAVDDVTPTERDATKARLFVMLYSGVPTPVAEAIAAIGADPEAGLADEPAADLEQRLDDELVAASELDAIPPGSGAGNVVPLTVGLGELGEAKARARAIDVAVRAMPRGTTRHAALPVRLREHETKITIPASPHERRITAIGFHPPDDAVASMLLRDIVVHVLVAGERVLQAPITFFNVVVTDAGGALVGEGTPLRPAPVIPPGATTEMLFRAWCTLPASGIGIVLHADVHTTAEPEPTA